MKSEKGTAPCVKGGGFGECGSPAAAGLPAGASSRTPGKKRPARRPARVVRAWGDYFVAALPPTATRLEYSSTPEVMVAFTLMKSLSLPRGRAKVLE